MGNTHYTCTLCNASVEKKARQDHDRNKCELRRVKCPKCSSEMSAKEQPAHEQLHCKERCVACEDCGEETVAKLLTKHKKSSCPERIELCQCSAQVVARLKATHDRDLCPFRLVTCSCGVQMKDQDLPFHKKNQCRTIVKCKCGESLMLKFLEAHENECLSFPVTCGTCGENFPTKSIYHPHKHACKKKPKPSSYRKSIVPTNRIMSTICTIFTEKAPADLYCFSVLCNNPKLVTDTNDIQNQSKNFTFSIQNMLNCIKQFKSSSIPRALIVLCYSKLLRQSSNEENEEMQKLTARFRNTNNASAVYVVDVDPDPNRKNVHLLQQILSPEQWFSVPVDHVRY